MRSIGSPSVIVVTSDDLRGSVRIRAETLLLPGARRLWHRPTAAIALIEYPSAGYERPVVASDLLILPQTVCRFAHRAI
jgi:hypothetical protein